MMTVSPEFAANNLLERLKIKSPEDLQDLEVLAYYLNVLVRYAPLDGSEARLSVVGSRAVITVSDKVENAHRQRFSIAHELGHWEMHRFGSRIAICTGHDLDEWGHQAANSIEREANLFAAAFLLPQRFFEPLCDQEDPSLDFISQLANRFRTSLTATALRFAQFCPEPVAVIYSQEGRVQWFSSSETFQELALYIERNVRLDPLSNAARLNSHQRYSSPRPVSASTWFARGRHDDAAQIIEHSRRISLNNAVLTLLWVNDDISSEDGFMWGR